MQDQDTFTDQIVANVNISNYARNMSTAPLFQHK